MTDNTEKIAELLAFVFQHTYFASPERDRLLDTVNLLASLSRSSESVTPTFDFEQDAAFLRIVANDAPTYSVDEAVMYCRSIADEIDNNEYTRAWRQDRDFLIWLASRLPEVFADQQMLDALVASPRQILVGEMPLRTAREHLRMAARLAALPDKPGGAASCAENATPLENSNDGVSAKDQTP